MRGVIAGVCLGAVLLGAGAAALLRRADSPARRHLESGRRLDAAGDPTGALHAWQVAAALDPELIEAREALGRTYLESGAPALALRELELVARRSPRREHAWCRLAEAYGRSGLLDSAREAAAYAAAVEPRCEVARRAVETAGAAGGGP